jgi:hypothetical protein
VSHWKHRKGSVAVCIVIGSGESAYQGRSCI